MGSGSTCLRWFTDTLLPGKLWPCGTSSASRRPTPLLLRGLDAASAATKATWRPIAQKPGAAVGECEAKGRATRDQPRGPGGPAPAAGSGQGAREFVIL